jgi:hypothetical protein
VSPRQNTKINEQRENTCEMQSVSEGKKKGPVRYKERGTKKKKRECTPAAPWHAPPSCCCVLPSLRQDELTGAFLHFQFPQLHPSPQKKKRKMRAQTETTTASEKRRLKRTNKKGRRRSIIVDFERRTDLSRASGSLASVLQHDVFHRIHFP